MITLKRTTEFSILALVCTGMGVASNLSFYYEGLVSMAYGTPDLPLLNLIAMWSAIILQPWIFLAAWLEQLTSEFDLFMSRKGSISSGVVSGLILTFVAWRGLRSRPKWLWSFSFLVALISIFCVSDMRRHQAFLKNQQGAPNLSP